METNKFKERIACPICGHEDTSVFWFSCPSKDKRYFSGFLSYSRCPPNSFFLCHWCGYFFREYCNGEQKEGLLFHHRKIPPKKQLRMIRKNHEKMEGLPLYFKD